VAYPQPANVTDFRALPKLDLHRHLEGSLRPETLWRFHQKQNQSMHANYESFFAATTIAPGVTPGFRSFLACFNGLRFRYGGVEEIEQIAAEAVADAADDGVVHLELRFSPVFCAWRMLPPPPPGVFAPLPDDKVAATASEAVVRGARREAHARGITVAFIVSLGRFASLEVNRPAVDLLTDRVGTDLAALDLAGDEVFPAREFAAFFKRWKDAGKGITIHAGEDASGPGAENVREAVEVLGADRIGHGVRAIEDRRVIDMLVRNKIALEICPTSNVQTAAVPSLREHPLKKFLDAEVCATINSDDPAISRITLSGECSAAMECGVSESDIRLCQKNALASAYVNETRRTELAQLIK
jgi:adenosine deaminase